MEQLNFEASNEIRAIFSPRRAEIFGKYDTLADQLLEKAVQHTGVWRRSFFDLSEIEAQAVYRMIISSGLESLIWNHKSAKHTKEYPSVNPKKGLIMAEEFDYREAYPNDPYAKRPHKYLGIWLDYKNDDPNLEYDARDQYFEVPLTATPYSLRISIEAGTQEVLRKVYSEKYIETGYEGHSRKFNGNTPLSQIEALYEILEKFAVRRISERPIMEQIEELKKRLDEEGEIK